MPQTASGRGLPAGRGRLHPDRSFQTIALAAGGWRSIVAALELGVRCHVLSDCAGAPFSVGTPLSNGAPLSIGAPLSSGSPCDGGDVPRGIALARTIVADAEGVGVADLRAWVASARGDSRDGEGACLVVDNRGAGPYLCRPLQMGADVVIESLWELVGGGLPADAGNGGSGALVAVARSETAWERFCGALGCDADGTSEGEPVGSGFEAAVRLGFATHSMRVQQACDNALVVAHYASKSPFVSAVRYPGLPEDPANATARRTLEHGFGDRVLLELAGAPPMQPGVAGVPLLPTGAVADPCSTTVSAPQGAARALLVTCGIESPLDIVESLEHVLAG